MVIDTSALLTILNYEAEAAQFASAIQDSSSRLISAATVLESAIVIEARYGEAGGKKLDELLAIAQIKIEPVTIEQVTEAVSLIVLMVKGDIRRGLILAIVFRMP